MDTQPQTQLFTNVLASNQIKIKELHDALPQLQCGRCDTPGCMEYAEEMANGAPNNRCLPGGTKTLKKLNQILSRDTKSLDDNFGPTINEQILFIDEDVCIGCAKCIPKCPVDAIIGAPNKLHQIDSTICTGCELCVEPCPVDCIHVKEVAIEATTKPRASSQERYNAKRQRTINTEKKLTLDTEKNLAIANLYKNLTH